jgi:DNA-binding transcriptional ArsR family regulator
MGMRKDIERWGFTKNEILLLSSISTKAKNISQIARETGISRTTLYTSLRNLLGRKIIESRQSGRSVLWTINEDFSLNNESKATKNIDAPAGFKVLKGIKELTKIWDKISLANKNNERVLGIQPTRSMINTISKMNPKELLDINNSILKNKVIIEGLLREDYYEKLIGYYKGDVGKQKDILKSFMGRATDMILVGNEYLNSDADLIILKDSAILQNWKTEEAIEIKNKDMIELLKELFDLARGYGRKVDQNEYLNGLYRKLENKEK